MLQNTSIPQIKYLDFEMQAKKKIQGKCKLSVNLSNCTSTSITEKNFVFYLDPPNVLSMRVDEIVQVKLLRCSYPTMVLRSSFFLSISALKREDK